MIRKDGADLLMRAEARISNMEDSFHPTTGALECLSIRITKNLATYLLP